MLNLLVANFFLMEKSAVLMPQWRDTSITICGYNYLYCTINFWNTIAFYNSRFSRERSILPHSILEANFGKEVISIAIEQIEKYCNFLFKKILILSTFVFSIKICIFNRSSFRGHK